MHGWSGFDLDLLNEDMHRFCDAQLWHVSICISVEADDLWVAWSCVALGSLFHRSMELCDDAGAFEPFGASPCFLNLVITLRATWACIGSARWPIGQAGCNMALTPEQMGREVAEQGSADLLFLLEESQVGIQYQHRVVVTHGYKTVRLLSGLEEDRSGVRAACKDVFLLDPTVPEERLTTAKLITVWEAARENLIHETKLRAEARVLGVTRQATQPERTAMKKLFELKFGKLQSHELPGIGYLSSKLEECEANEPYASKLDEVLSADDQQDFTVSQSHDQAGRVFFVKKRPKGTLPTDPEQLRAKIRLECNTWCMLAEVSKQGLVENYHTC